MSIPAPRRTRLASWFLFSIAAPAVLFGQWSSLPGVNNAIVTDTSIYPQSVVMISDGAGGAVCLWYDWRVNSNDSNLYAQRLDASGLRLWGDNGTPVCDLPGTINSHNIIADGEGGFFVAWSDRRVVNGVETHHTYVQRLNGAGQPLWAANGVLVRQYAHVGSVGTDETLLNDGAGGCYVVTFADANKPAPEPGGRIFRINGSGEIATGWPAVGVQFPDGLRVNGMVSDQPENAAGEHGVLLCQRFAVQRVAADGTLGFSTNLFLGNGAYDVQGTGSDGAGGMLVITGGGSALFVFRVQTDGTMAWPETNRRVIVTGGSLNNQYADVDVFPDGAGGTLVAWLGVAPETSSLRMAAQRISATGDRLWGDHGVEAGPVGTFGGDAVSDGAGGLIVASLLSSPSELRAQRLDANGNLLWPADGVLVAAPATLAQLVTDQASGAVYSVIINNGGNNYTFGAKRTTLTGSLGSNSPLARLVNISSRAQVGAGDDVLIPGFIVTGGNVELLVRAIGPSLAQFNVSGVLPDPQITLFNATNQAIGSNDDWGASSNAATIASVAAQVFAFPLAGESKDAALHVTLAPGLYTAVMRGAGATTGVGLVELYEVGGAANAGRLGNMSVRARVGTGDAILIPGIIIGGSEARTVLIRAIGPTLSVFNVAGVLADPQLALFNHEGTQVAVNDNWGTPNGTQIANFGAQVGAFALPAGSKDAAFLVTLSPGLYSAQVSGVNSTTGVCLVEVYEVQ